jgi:hypothetical protein
MNVPDHLWPWRRRLSQALAATRYEVVGTGGCSRISSRAAGWGCRPASLPPGHSPPQNSFSWLQPKALWDCRNEVIARVVDDPTNAHRERWMEILRTHGRARHSDLMIRDHADCQEISFAVMGDTGEGDVSQYSVVMTLLEQTKHTAFMFLCSDVIYPAAGIEEYGQKFLRPYADYPRPIYAIPGNHDWYDNADGFMYWFCGADTRPKGLSAFARDGWREIGWRRSPIGRTKELEKLHRLRNRGSQPGPYFAVAAGPLLLIGLDTGLGGKLDESQCQWLRTISAVEDRPKILLTGKPLFSNGRFDPRPLDDNGTVWDVVTDPRNRYLAVISGDIHNYQRYLVTLADGRRMPFIVSGGGGAFLHETHTIPNLDRAQLPGVDEESFRCYPLRGDSLARCSQLWSKKLGVAGLLALDPDDAAQIAARRIGLKPVRLRAHARLPSQRSLATAEVMYRLARRPHPLLHVPFSELLDWGEPPLFKHFLHVSASPQSVTIRCHAVTGCREQEGTPVIEDKVVATRAGHDQWTWRVAGEC